MAGAYRHVAVSPASSSPAPSLADEPSAQNFALIAYVFFVIITGGGLPTPLYVVYQKLWGFPASTLTIVFAVYAAGLLLTLILVRHHVDRPGHRRLLLAGVGVAIVSTFVFLAAASVVWLILARLLSGISVGLVASTATRGLSQTEPHGDRRRAAQWITVITAVGVGVGPFYAGILVEYAPLPLTLSFWVLLALLAAAVVATLLIVEPRNQPTPPPSPVGRGFHVPAGIRGVFRLTALSAFVGFTLAGMFSGLAPSFLGSDLKITNHAISGGVVLLMFGTAALVQLAMQRRDRVLAMRVGGALVPVGLGAIATAVWTGLSLPFFLGTLVCGAGFGLCLMGGLGLLNEVVPPELRGEVVSGFYVASYLGLSVPIVSIGVLADLYGLPAAAVALSAAIALLAIPVIVARPSERPATPLPPAPGPGTPG